MHNIIFTGNGSYTGEEYMLTEDECQSFIDEGFENLFIDMDTLHDCIRRSYK